MRVRFYKPNGQVLETHEIATPKTDGMTGPDGFLITRTNNVEIAEYFRGESIVPIDRDNARTQIEFNTSKTHSRLVDAEDYALNSGEIFAAVGKIEFEAYELGGARKIRYLETAAIQSVQSSYAGVTTFHKFTVVGGKMILKG